MSRIFISYRRADSAMAAGRLYDHLSAHFGANLVFMDIDTIEPGEDFVEVIQNAVSASSAVVAVIGEDWLSITDASGQRRLDNPGDFVRLEIETALERNIRLIPVLVDGAVMPGAEDLPESLVKLTRRNALVVSNERFRYDVGKLIETLDKVTQTRLRAEKEAVVSTELQPPQNPVPPSSQLTEVNSPRQAAFQGVLRNILRPASSLTHLVIHLLRKINIHIGIKSKFTIAVIVISLAWSIALGLALQVSPNISMSAFFVAWGLISAFGGGVTGLTLQWIKPSRLWKYILVVPLSWIILGVVVFGGDSLPDRLYVFVDQTLRGRPFPWNVPELIRAVINAAIMGGAGGLAIGLVSSVKWRYRLLMTIVWGVSWVIGIVFAPSLARLWPNPFFNIFILVGVIWGIIIGVVGGGFTIGILLWTDRSTDE